MNRLYGTYGPINIKMIFEKTHYTIYPEISNYSKCAAMLLNNLVNPEWITIDCDEPVTSDIMCHFPRKIKQHINWITEEEIKIYNSSCVHKNETCFIFLWSHFVSNIHSNNNKLLRKEIDHINVFQYLFSAVSVSFPPIMLADMKYTMSYIRYGNSLSYITMEANKSTETLLIFTQVHIDPRNGGNIFKCKKYLISIEYLCDGKVDCESSEKLDEIDCQCKETEMYSSRCKYVISANEPKFCSDFYIKTTHHDCRPFAKFTYSISRKTEDWTRAGRSICR